VPKVQRLLTEKRDEILRIAARHGAAPAHPRPRSEGGRAALRSDHERLLVHRYFGIDNDVVWSAVETRLPELQDRISVILREMGGT